jgi:hypothetical protein
MFAIAQETAMATLKITDEFGLNTTVQFRDDSPFATSKLIHIAAVGQGLKNEIDKPIDQTFLKGFTFGADWSSPTSMLADVAKVTGGAGVCGAVSIARPIDKTLFPDDGFAPKIALTPDQCWVGIEIDASVDASLKASADGFGVGIAGTTKLGLTTHTLINKSGGQFPVLLDGLKAALDSFYVVSTAEALRNLPVGIVCVSELGGTVAISGSYQLPVSITPLASADLPFNYKVSVQPDATLKLAGSIAFSGDLIVRAHKLTGTTLEIGVYKKKGSTLSASFTAESGVGIDLGTTDLAAAILNTAFPGVNSKGAGISGGSAEELNDALKDCVDRSLSIAMNVSCSAATTDEAAVIYHVDLSTGSADTTNAALKSALHGDWTLLARLPNAQSLRNIVTDSKEYKHKLAINLFGIYNAENVDTYVQSCTILHDENGHVSVIDKASASRISVAAMPYAADADKLRTALAQDFLATISYAVVASKVQPALAIQQSYFLYDKALPRQKMVDQILLGVALKLFAKGDWDATLRDSSVFPHAHISASAKYKDANILSLFFSDPIQHKPRTRAEIERAGRDAMIASIDPGDPAGSQRLSVLNDDQIWSAMDSTGNIAAFNTIPGLTQLSLPLLEAVGTDWEAIAWWADSMQHVPPRLADTLGFLATLPASGDFSANPDFIAKTKLLQNALAGVARKTHAAFAGGWGMAVVFALAGTGAERDMDISWSSSTKHYEANG